MKINKFLVPEIDTIFKKPKVNWFRMMGAIGWC